MNETRESLDPTVPACLGTFSAQVIEGMGRRELKMRVIAFSGSGPLLRQGFQECLEDRVPANWVKIGFIEEAGPIEPFGIRGRLQMFNSRSRVTQQALETGEVKRRGTWADPLGFHQLASRLSHEVRCSLARLRLGLVGKRTTPIGENSGVVRLQPMCLDVFLPRVGE